MTLLLAALVGYAIGSIPTAGWLGKMVGIDLTKVGSGNPGANNALQQGGAGLASRVLLVEMIKGAGAVVIGKKLGGDAGAVVAGLGAVTGNLYNVYYGFRGGKGLGITAGVLAAAWPLVFIPIVVVIALASWATHSTGGGTIIAIVALVLLTWVWNAFELPMAWGIADRTLLAPLAIGLAILVAPKHWAIARFRRSSPVSPR